MISFDSMLAFIAASALITIAPGPDNLMVLSVGISRGRSAGIGFGLGCALGCFTHTLWATLGIGAVVLASEATFTTLKMAGAAYLVYIGIMAWRYAGKMGVIMLDPGAAEPITAHLRRGFHRIGQRADHTGSCDADAHRHQAVHDALAEPLR